MVYIYLIVTMGQLDEEMYNDDIVYLFVKIMTLLEDQCTYTVAVIKPAPGQTGQNGQNMLFRMTLHLI